MKTCIIFALLVMFAIPVEALTYKWIDDHGTINYTEDLGNVPQKYRKKVKIVGEEEDVASPEPGGSKEGLKPEKKDKAKGDASEQTNAPEKKKTYGGKSAETWKRDFAQVNDDIKTNEDQLSELKDRMKDTSKMSRGEYLSVQAGINRVEARLQRLRGKRDSLTDEANRALVPAEFR
jgi:chromosome segregation ATPase